ncbi:hypothetical protein LXL04_037467 [Taraxacum kok-saghyz]
MKNGALQLAMKGSETISDYFARVMSVSNKMRCNGEAMPDSKIVEKILFTYVVVSIEESKDTTKMSIDELQSSLMVHEQKFRRYEEDEEQVLKVEDMSGTRGRGRPSPQGNGRGRGRSSFNKAAVQCYECHNFGHFSYECPTLNKEANYVEQDEDKEVLLMAYVQDIGPRRDVWYIDSAASNHMCGIQGMFTSLDTSFSHIVRLGNDTGLRVMGIGAVKIVLQGIKYVISDVYYIPELKNNLLSVGQFQEKGVSVIFDNGVCILRHPQKGKMVESTMRSNRMYIVHSESSSAIEEERCLHVKDMDQSKLWHHRYGHLSYTGLYTLHNKKMVVGLPQMAADMETCEACMKGKQHRLPIPKTSN